MKSQERHKLKENEFARTVAHAREVLSTRQRDITWIVVVVVALLAIVGGYTWWRQSTRDAATESARQRRSRSTKRRSCRWRRRRPAARRRCSSPARTRPSRRSSQAALPKFIEAADKYPSTTAGIAARYHAAAILASLGRYSEAEQRYQEVVSRARHRRIYGRTAQARPRGSAGRAGQVRQRDQHLHRAVSRDTNSQMPVDGVLMQLGRAYALAGRKEEAVRAFTRVIEEFPQSMYSTTPTRGAKLARRHSKS